MSADRQKNSAGRMHMEEKLKSSEQQTSRMGYRFHNLEPFRAEWGIIFESKRKNWLTVGAVNIPKG